jgi:phytoene dehydrogenase-like protein
MAIAISPIGNTLYEPRALRPLDDNTTLELRNRFDTLNPTSAERLQDRLQLTRERAAERFARQQELAEERRELLREELAEQARQAADEATSSLQDRLRQQQVERVLEAQRADQLQQSAERNDPLAPQNLTQPRAEANQLTFGPPQTVTTRTAIEAITTYQETRDLIA